MAKDTCKLQKNILSAFPKAPSLTLLFAIIQLNKQGGICAGSVCLPLLADEVTGVLAPLHHLGPGSEAEAMAGLGMTKRLDSMDIVEDVAMAVVHGKVR